MIKNFDAYWVGNGWGYPRMWALKREMPALDAGQVAIRGAAVERRGEQFSKWTHEN